MNHTRTRKTVRSLLVWLLMLTMVFSLLPMAAFADEVGSGVQPADIVDVDAPESGETGEETGETGENTGDTDPSAPTGDADVTITDGDEDEPEADTQAADELTSNDRVIVIAGSDFQHPSGNTSGQETVKAILQRIADAGLTSASDVNAASGFLFAGDYEYDLSTTSETTINSNRASLQSAVESVYTIPSENQVYVQGNHDLIGIGKAGMSTSGAHDTDDYGVFVINEDDYMWQNSASNSSTSYPGMSAQAIVQQTANNLKTYLAGRRIDQPVFVISHLPLHYTLRTIRDGDGTYANLLFDVLNEAGANGLNIIFLFGHNHSHGWDDYLGGAEIFLTKGDKIRIAQGSSSESKEETLQFTYMNAGYVGYYSYNGADKVDSAMGASAPLTMTAFEINGSSVTAYRFDRNGGTLLKAVGERKEDSGYWNGYTDYQDELAVNTKTYSSPITVTAEPFAVPSLSINGNVVKTYTADVDNGEFVVSALNFKPTEWTSSDTEVATVSEGTVKPLKDGTTTIKASDASGNSAELALTVTQSEHRTIYLTVGQTVQNTFDGESVNEITSNDPSGIVEASAVGTTGSRASYTLGSKVSSITSGNKYVIKNNLSNKYLTNAADGSMLVVSDSITSDDGTIDSSAIWEITNYSSQYYYVKSSDSGKYLTFGSAYANTSDTANTSRLRYNNSLWTIYQNSNYLNNYGGQYANHAAGYGENDGGSKWNIYSVNVNTVETSSSTTVTFKGVAPGTATVVVGGVTYTVIVRDKSQLNDYPEYPDEGSVTVSKTGTGVDFQNTGVAKVELSTSGVPMTKGVDVVLMLDTSSSMNDTVDGQTRLAVMKASVANMLATFNTPDATTGVTPDIRIAIADFNGYDYNNTASPIYLDNSGDLIGSKVRNSENTAKVYTGSQDYTSNAFESVSNYNTAASRTALVDSIKLGSGTNYDAAFYYTYQLASAISSEEGYDRDLYVVFMSDGAPFQYNFFNAYSNVSEWNNWLQGTSNPAASKTHAYFYNSDSNKNWWAEAVKGDVGTMYTVIDKTSTENYNDQQYMKQVRGLGAKMYSIGFCLAVDDQITVESMENVLQKIATDSTYYFKADSANDLNSAFTQIASNVKKAGQNAVFTDKLGEAYDLRLTPIQTTDNGTVVNPVITVSTYELYKKSEVGTTVNGVTVTADMVGTRKSNTPKVQETVTFNPAGTEAYSDKSGSTNILTDNKINAKLFTYDLTTETFSWNVGDITEDEQVLTYYVYLTGSMEGTRGAGSYPTNESAVLNYKNWLDHDAHKDTVSPVMPWKSANVSYAFYLVDGNGNPIVNQTTGEIGSFANAVKITQPVVYSEVLLNSAQDIDAEVVAQDALPAGYELFDTAAAYKISVKSGSGAGSWTITNGQAVATTYVAQYDTKDSSAVTNKVNSSDVNGGKNDYTHTVVWFAVKYVIGCVPDSVVIDFGLPVDISVLGNDILGENATVAGIRGSVDGLPTAGTSTLATDFVSEITGKFGSAAVNGSKVRYTPGGMTMNDVETFAYSAQANLTNDSKYYYSTVTVIPAANIYYEDSFVTFSDGWERIGKTEDGITQQEDRPGQFSLAAYDANNVYGYDAAYKECNEYSLGSAMKTTVTKATNSNPPTATFTFTGTGFDLISLTSKDTGAIFVDVVGGNNVEENWIVNTYYGYTRTDAGYNKYTWTKDDGGNWHSTREVIGSLPDGAVLDGTPTEAGDITYSKNYTWEVTSDTDNALYQIPVIRAQGLEYGEYTVTVTPMYSSMQDPNKDGSYDFYLDAVRIYDPAGENPDGTIGDAYKADNEGWPQIIELRNQLIDFGALSVDTTTSAKGIVFVDGNGAAELSDYTNFGPNNEVYLAANQAIAFKLNVADSSNIAAIQIAAKAPNGTAKAQVNNGTVTEIATATEMYYTITHRITWPNNGKESGVIVVANVGENILSLTNIKITYKTDPSGSTAAALVDDAVVSEAPAVLMSMLGIEPPQEKTFEPDSVSMSWNKVRQGGRAVLTVKTSEDVTAISVNGGEPIENYQTRTERTGWSWNAKRVTYHVFTYTVDNAQTAEYEIVAINSDGAVSEKTYTTTLVVKSASPIRDWLDDLFGRWF